VNERADRNKKIVAAMAADGLDISLEALEKAYPDSLLGRPHMAEYLMKKGYVTTVKEAFDKYLGEGCPYYRDKERMPMAQAVQVIGQAGGIAVVAHPLQYGYEGQALEDFLQTAKALGCAALEAYYAEHSPAQQAFLLQKAQTLGLGVSGGSDYHGSRKPHIQMGSGIENSLSIPYAVLEALGTRKS
jgi:predicted metal-dependent phosphoesterase TrpH